jgi:hypothetical protein
MLLLRGRLSGLRLNTAHLFLCPLLRWATGDAGNVGPCLLRQATPLGKPVGNAVRTAIIGGGSQSYISEAVDVVT